MTRAIAGGRVLLADGFADGVVVITDNGLITELRDESDALPTGCDLLNVDGRYIVPGFIDTQVNGGGGVLFNDAPTVEGLAAIASAHRAFGTTGMLPTLISDDLGVVARAISAVTEAIRCGVVGILGLHIEGPFLAESKRGIHDARFFRVLDADTIDLLSQPTGGRTVVTLAPECSTAAQIQQLVERGVIVSLGHTNATAADAIAAFDAGATGVTHLYNAMSQLQGRAPGVVGASLLDPRPWCGLIVDGHHVDPLALRVALAARPHTRVRLVSDAMHCVGSDLTSFSLLGRTITVADGVCRGDDGTLAGSAADMLTCVRTAAQTLSLPLATVFRMASEYPADFLGLSASHGRIAPGYQADLLVVAHTLDQVRVLT